MKLLKLTTKNFKRLGSGEFEFTDGVNFVVGPNAAGKSTLLRAVSVALFGVSALPGVASDVATWGTQSWSLHLEFEHAGVTYGVTRDHKTTKVMANGELVANGNRPSTTFVEGLLNRSLKDFNLLSNSRQGETTYALNYGAAALQRDVERLSGADAIEKIIGAAKTLRTKLDAEVEAASTYLLNDDDIKLLGLRLVEAAQQIKKANADTKALDTVLAEPSPIVTVTDPKHLRKAREKYVAYEVEMGNYRKTKADLEAQLAEMGEEHVEDLDVLEEQRKLVEILTASRRQWERACDERASVEKQLVEIVIPEGDFKSRLDEVQADLAAHEASEAKVSALVTEKHAAIKHLEKHVKEGVCSACGTVLKGDLEEVKAKLERARNDLKLLQVSSDDTHTLVVACRKGVAALNAQITVQVERTEQKIKLQKCLAEIDHGTWTDASDPARLKEAKALVSKLEEARRAAVEHNKARRKLVGHLDKLEAPEVVEEVTEADVAFAETAWSEYQSAQSAWQVAQAAAKERRASALASAKASETTLVATRDTLAAHNRTLELVASKKAKASLAERLVNFLRERREFYLTQVWATVLGAASRFLQASTESWMTGMNLKDGTFMFEDNGGAWVPAVEASGAQGAFLGVALRVGLARALDHDRSLLILDEPTEAMREDNARRLMAGVGAARDQVIVVTHRTTDQGLADNIIEIGDKGALA